MVAGDRPSEISVYFEENFGDMLQIESFVLNPFKENTNGVY